MKIEIKLVEDKIKLANFFQNNPEYYIYQLGDLDDFFWDYTSWYAYLEDGKIKDVLLLYTGLSDPTILALSQTDNCYLNKIIEIIKPDLPDNFYAHLSSGLVTAFNREFKLTPHGEHFKMVLKDSNKLDIDISDVFRLGVQDCAELFELYSKSYPENWFDRRMLETGMYFGCRENQKLIAVAGVHVYSPEYQVAALGNITTDPEYRGNGYGTKVTAYLCRELLQSVAVIGLNVKADNQAAISCYQKLGFEVVAEYSEFSAECIT